MSKSIDTRKDSLFDPIMYMIDREVKRAFSRAEGGTDDSNVKPRKEYIEPIKLSRDSRGRLTSVEGWEHVDAELKYSANGILDHVIVTQRLTEKQLKINLVYDERKLLQEVIPEILEEGSGDPGYIDIPSVIPDY